MTTHTTENTKAASPLRSLLQHEEHWPRLGIHTLSNLAR